MGAVMKRGPIGLVILGVVLILAPLSLISGYSSYMSTYWNITHVDVLLHRDMVERYAVLSEVRDAYPSYDGLTDEELTERLRRKYFGYFSPEEYHKMFLAPPPSDGHAIKRYSGSRRDPLDIMGEIEEYELQSPLVKSHLLWDAVDSGLYDSSLSEIAIPYRYTFAAGLALLAAGVLLAFLNRKKAGKGTGLGAIP